VSEEISLEAYASLGIGREHARFNPVSQCSYSYTRDKDPGRVQQLWETWLREQKKRDPQELQKKPEEKAILEREFRSLEIYRCFQIDADGEPFSYDFTVETLGTMNVFKIISQALAAVATRCDPYAAMDAGDVPANLDIRPADARLKGFDFWFKAEDHTLGCLISTWIDLNSVGDGQTSYVGYKVPHPLRDEMVLRVGVEDGNESTARLVVATAAKACADMYRGWATQWSGAAASSGSLTPNVSVEPKTVWQAHTAAKSRSAKAK